MNFEEAISYMQNLTKFGFNFGLGRIRELMARVGNPHQQLKIIHVGGTNGKGSTAAILSSILREAGFKVGVFSSPHLHSYTERYRINGKEISETDIARLIEEIRPHLDAMVSEGFEHPTEFEVSTALAFKYFHQEKVDFLILEVGLGGAIDSTNVIEESLVSILTNVGMDHMEYLGNTVEEIAKVKAGIVKDKGNVITATQRSEVLEVIKTACEEKKADLLVVGQDTKINYLRGSVEGNWFDYNGLILNYNELFLPLVGEHQVTNAATALTAVEVLIDKGYLITEEAIRSGLDKSKWPARLELMQKDPLVVIDGAHNLDGAIQLKKALESYYSYNKLILIIGMLGDKEREKVTKELVPLANKVIVTKPNNPRAGNWQEIANEAKLYCKDVILEEEITEAVKKGLAAASKEDMLCITGSLYMVASAREFWTKNT